MGCISQLSIREINEITDRKPGSLAAFTFPFYKFDAPGMPPAGPNYLAMANALAGGKDAAQRDVDFWLNWLYLRTLYDNSVTFAVWHRNETRSVQTVVGHFWGGPPEGPRIAERWRGKVVMIVGKHPGFAEIQQGRNFVGDSGQKLREAAMDNGATEEEIAQCYVCNLVRWRNLNRQSSTMPAAWVKDCLPLLHQEIRLLRPRLILCLGAEAIKAVCGTGHTLRNMIGRHVDLTIPLGHTENDESHYVTRVMGVTHPARVCRDTEFYPQLKTGVGKFLSAVRGITVESTDDAIKYDIIDTHKQLKSYVDSVLAVPGLKKIAVDAEWEGQHHSDPGAYLRTVQLAYDWRNPVVIVLRKQGGDHAFQPNEEKAFDELKRLLDRDDVQIGGSFPASDIAWLLEKGVDLRHRLVAPATVEALNKGNYPGFFEVALAYHAWNETADYQLEMMAVELCGASRWDIELLLWKKQYCAKRGIKEADLEGYGNCPNEILFPYAARDAAYTRLLMDKLVRCLDSDMYGNDCWLPYWISLSAMGAFIEMHLVGTNIDPVRIDQLTDLYMEVRDRKLEEFRRVLNWPTFNQRSPQQSVELLFGEAYSTRINKETGERESVRPPGAVSLYLTPVKSTGQQSRSWDLIRAQGQENNYTPCTDKEVCGILSVQDTHAGELRDIRMLDQLLKSVLCPPELDATGNKPILHNGSRVYKKGHIHYLRGDRRLHAAFRQVLQARRTGTARPPLQNLPKRREVDYKRILGDDYQWAMRSFMCGTLAENRKESTVLIEGDLEGAELFVMAVTARDERMIDHCLRAALPDGDPNKYDIHSNIAVATFGLDCPPTKKGLESIGRPDLRVAAKGIIFGVDYGRTAEACAREAQAEGIMLTTAEAQRVIDMIFSMYQGIPVIQDALKSRVLRPGWIRNCFGGYRRFIPTTDNTALHALQRKAMNFPFQSAVAEAISLALRLLVTHPRKELLGYKLVSQIHDAVLLEVPAAAVDEVVHEILPECMCRQVAFRSCDLDGVPYRSSPEYHFSIETNVSFRWGEKLTPELCDHLGISKEYS